MSYVTHELLKKSSEHNEMCLSTLEEISLHQRELVKIDLLETYCKHLKIVLLQNNIIPKMENLSKLKELEYLNMALNNISMIEGIEGCESLKKLDLTCNFIDVDDFVESLTNLAKCPKIESLFMLGNPCMDWAPSKAFIMALVPQLKTLDGAFIKSSDRIQAIQKKEEMLKELKVEIARVLIVREQKKGEPKKYNEEGEELIGYSKESRNEMYIELAEQKLADDKSKNPDKYKPKKPQSRKTYKDGKLRQCNEGSYPFQLNEYDDPIFTTFTVQIPKFCDTSLVQVDVVPWFVSVRIKGKLTQLRFNEEVVTDGAIIQRSQVTGELLVKVKKLTPNHVVSNMIKKEQEQKRQKRLKQEKIQQTEDENLKVLIKTQEKKYLLKSEEPKAPKIDFQFDDIPDLE